MAVKPEEDPPPPAVVETVGEIMKTYRSLPPRPTIEELEAAMSVLKTVDSEEQTKLEEISKQKVPKDVPEELFSLLQQVRKDDVLYRSYDQRKEALHLVELDKVFQTFDDLILRASALVSGDTQNQKRVDFGDPVEKIVREVVISDERLVKNSTEEVKPENYDGVKGLVKSASMKTSFFSG